MPKGKEFIENLKIKKNLLLETADYTLFLQPYGPAYPNAVGKISEYIPGGPDCIDGYEIPKSFVKSISPKLPEGYYFPIKILKQKTLRNEKIVCVDAVIDVHKKYIDKYSLNGKEIKLELYLSSVLRRVIGH